MKTNQPLLGHFKKLSDLFISIRYVNVKQPEGRYDKKPWEIPLKGLPGCVDTKTGSILVVAPLPSLDQELRSKCLNGVIDSFRVIRSAELMKEGLLPVYCSDGYGRSFLIATVPYSEHERFNRG